MTSTILEMRDITKTFPGVKALSNVNLSVEEGEIHAVVGENGAGKSTLMKVLSGVYPSGTYDGTDRLSRAGVPFQRHPRQRTSGHRHHPPGACAGADAVDRREHLSRQRARQVRRHRLERQRDAHQRPAQEGRPQRGPQDADHQYRRRQAATGRDRQGAQQGSASCSSSTSRRPACPKRTARRCSTCCSNSSGRASPRS